MRGSPNGYGFFAGSVGVACVGSSDGNVIGELNN
jgi:hypothetical protein